MRSDNPIVYDCSSAALILKRSYLAPFVKGYDEREVKLTHLASEETESCSAPVERARAK